MVVRFMVEMGMGGEEGRGSRNGRGICLQNPFPSTEAGSHLNVSSPALLLSVVETGSSWSREADRTLETGMFIQHSLCPELGGRQCHCPGR